MFKRGETVYLPCKLSQGGFASERVFRVVQADRSEYVGAAPIHYCWAEGGRRLADGQPAKGSPIPGFVQGYLIANGGDLARVETPDGEAVQVEVAAIRPRREVDPEPYPDVPVGS